MQAVHFTGMAFAMIYVVKPLRVICEIPRAKIRQKDAPLALLIVI